MTHSLVLSRRSLGIPAVVLITSVGVVSVFASSVVGVFVSVVILGTLAFSPRLNPLVFWPVGLFVATTVGYTSYIVYWISDTPGINENFAHAHFVSVLSFFGAFSLFRIVSDKQGRAPLSPNFRGISASLLSAALPLTLLWVGTSRFSSESLSLFSGYMSGGDHGLHNEIVHNLLSWSRHPSSENPFTLYTYPKGLHFLVALFVATGSSSSVRATLIQEYLTGAWFEYVQLAAYVQLAIAILVFWRPEMRVRRAIFIAPILLSLASMDHFVGHLFWSGFTTSTGITWAFLIPVALWVVRRPMLDVGFTRSERVGCWILLLLFSWIVYQPYLIVVATTGLAILAVAILGKFKLETTFLPFSNKGLEPLVAFLVALVGAVVPYFVLGADSAAVRSLLLDGSTWRASIATVSLWTGAAVLFSTVDSRKTPSNGNFPAIVVSSLLGFTAGMASVVFFLGRNGLFDMPYYIQKMYWVVLYVSVPIALGAGLTWVLGLRALSPGHGRTARLVPLWMLMVLVPMLQGRTPHEATTHLSVDWFAHGVFEMAPSDGVAVGAFSMRDRLGSHMSNLALRSASTSVLPPDVAISGNPYLACSALNKADVRTVYTTPNGGRELLESGCNPEMKFVEDGKVLPQLEADYFGLATSITERPALGQPGFRFLVRGFLPPEKWGVWAGGYRSTFGFSYETDVSSPVLSLQLRSYPKDIEQRIVVIRANNSEVARHRLSFVGTDEVRVSLPYGRAQDQMEITLTCEKTDEEIAADDPIDGPTPCVGLESIRLVDVKQETQ